ncbi:MAG: glycosyltransferase [Planctomycetota bacterium]|jgi:glycosyltransferase involved in cell wall biosynthesis
MVRPRVLLDLTLLADPDPGSAARWLEPAVEAASELAGIEIIQHRPTTGLGPLRRRKALLDRARETRADVLHLFTSGALLPKFLARSASAPRIVQTVHELPWLHGVDEGSDPAHRAWVRLLAHTADHVVCPSAHVGRDLKAQPFSLPPMSVIPWGVDPAFHEAGSRGTRDSGYLVLPNADRDKKRASLAVEALSRIDSPLELRLTGEGGAGLEHALATAHATGVAERVVSLGRVDDAFLPGLYADATAVLCLSASEGFCLPAAEARAAGTAVVVPRDSAQAETAGALAVPCDDPLDAGSVAHAIERARAMARPPADDDVHTWSAWADSAAQLWCRLAGGSR